MTEVRGAAAGQREISRLAKRPWPEFIEEDSMKTQATMKTAPAAKKPGYIMIGGFLGAGKTTAVGKLAALADGAGACVPA